MSERIIVNIASYNRVESLIKTLESIIDQCDIINLTLNSHDGELNKIFYHEKVNLVFSDNSLGDSMKFYKLVDSDGYFLTIDDDLIYPSNYVEFMVNKCKEHENKKVITLHGRNFSKFPINSYYRSANERYSCFDNVNNDVKVQFGGTGVMCFHTSLMKIPIDYFSKPNMADVWVGKFCIENSMDILCLKHRSGYVKYMNQRSTIFDTHSNNDQIQTLVVNSVYDKTIKLDFSSVSKNNDNKSEELSIPIKSTIEKTEKTINYEKINQIFNTTPTHISTKPKNVGGTSSLRTNTSIVQKLNKKGGRG